jgi:hypothetical protein
VTTSLGDIRAGLKANLDTIAAPFFAYAAEPNAPEPPCAWPWPDDPFIDRESMHMGVMCTHWKIVVLVAAGDNEHGIDQLDSYLVTSGEKSVWAAIESDRRAPQGALNGAASDVIVAQVRRWDGNYIVGGNGYFAAELAVTVYGTG